MTDVFFVDVVLRDNRRSSESHRQRAVDSGVVFPGWISGGWVGGWVVGKAKQSLLATSQWQMLEVDEEGACRNQ